MSSAIVQNVRFVEIKYRQAKAYPLGLRTRDWQDCGGRYTLIRLRAISRAICPIQSLRVDVEFVQFSTHGGVVGPTTPGVFTSPARIGIANKQTSIKGANNLVLIEASN